MKKPARSPEQRFDDAGDVDPEDSARIRRHPAALEQVGPDDESRPRPVDEMAYSRSRASTSGTLSSLGDTDQLPVVESGLPLEPEDLGRQFLRDATEQDNFESELALDEPGLGGSRLGQVVSEATLEAAGQEEYGLPESGAFSGLRSEVELEPPAAEVDMLSNAIHEASLFDQRTEDLEEGDALQPAYVRGEDVQTGRDPSAVPITDEEAREREFQRTRRTLMHGRGGIPTEARESARPAFGGGSRTEVRSARQARHAAHVVQTSRRTAHLVQDVTGLEDFDQAMAALEVVVAAIVQRITPGEARDLLAQLPAELREHITATSPSGPDESLTRETIESELSKRLDLEPADAAALLERIGTALEHLVTPGELAHVRAQLPKELQAIFRGEVAHRTP